MMQLRPHHLLDIVTAHGHGQSFEPHPYGHAVHTVAAAVLSDLDLDIEFIVGADAICQPCKHLQPDGRCDDMLHRLDPPVSKQAYNDGLDRRLLAYLELQPGAVLTVRRFLERVGARVPGIETVCTHPKRDERERLAGLAEGLAKLGIQTHRLGGARE